MIRLVMVIAVSIMLFSCDTTKKNVKMTANGFEYQIIESNPDNREIQETDYVTVEIKVMSDTEETIQPVMKGSNAPVIPILSEEQAGKNPVPLALKGAHEGDSLIIITPMDSLPNVPEQFANYEHMRYELRVVKVQSEADHNAEVEALRIANEKKIADAKIKLESILSNYKSGNLSDLEVTENDVKIHYINKGDGGEIQRNDQVKVDYYGALMSGTSFDNSFQRGMPFELNVGQGLVIPGWDEALLNMRYGDEAIVFIPFRQAYGEQGSGSQIPPESDLVFYMHVLEK